MLIEPTHLDRKTLDDLLWGFYLDKPHRLPTLFELVDKNKINPVDFWHYLPAVWTNSESTEQCQNLRWFYKVIDKLGFNNRPKSLVPFDKMAKNCRGGLKLYRGGDASELEQPSWSTKRKVAEKFLFYYPNDRPTLFTAKVSVDDIIFYTNERNEAEVVVKRGSPIVYKAEYFEWPENRSKGFAAFRTDIQQGLAEAYEIAAISAKHFGNLERYTEMCEEALAYLDKLDVVTPREHWQKRLAAFKAIAANS